MQLPLDHFPYVAQGVERDPHHLKRFLRHRRIPARSSQPRDTTLLPSDASPTTGDQTVDRLKVLALKLLVVHGLTTSKREALTNCNGTPETVILSRRGSGFLLVHRSIPESPIALSHSTTRQIRQPAKCDGAVSPTRLVKALRLLVAGVDHEQLALQHCSRTPSLALASAEEFAASATSPVDPCEAPEIAGFLGRHA